ncbi:hypothetical protein ABPG72_015802 [Tetrahymena utriculariae]
MAQEPKYQKVQENSQFLVNPEKLIEISKANTEQSNQVKQFLELYAKTAEWKKFKEGFLSMNYIFKPEDVIHFLFCPSSNTSVGSFYPKKKKIYICQNYMTDQNMFNAFVNYNMTLLYDILRSDVDFQSCPQILCMNIRATHISSFCKSNDKICFQNHLKKQLVGLKPCENQFDNHFDKAFQQCLLDLAPIHSIKTRIN